MWVIVPAVCLSLTLFTCMAISRSMILLQMACFHPSLRLSSIPLRLPWQLSGKESACCAGDPGPTHGSGISPGEGNGNPLQDCCLESPMDSGAWRAAVQSIVQSGSTSAPPRVCTASSLSIHPRGACRLLPQLGWCCYGHREACVFMNYSFVQVYVQEWALTVTYLNLGLETRKGRECPYHSFHPVS